MTVTEDLTEDLTEERPEAAPLSVETTESVDAVRVTGAPRGEPRGSSRERSAWRRPTGSALRRWVTLGLLCVLVFAAAEAVVFYGVGALLHNRDQRALAATERLQIQEAAGVQDGLYRKPLPTLPPTPGTPVGMLVIPALGLQQAVVEGVGASQTAEGPGHVPGTAGLGQPGNAAIVGRGAGDGGPFGALGTLRRGDHIVTATIQGESLYVVTSVETGAVVTHAPITKATAGPQSVGSSTSPTTQRSQRSGATAGRPPRTLNLQALFGATSKDQLILVTSGSGVPWNSNDAVVVVARMRAAPYAPTPQEGRSLQEQGTTGDADAAPWLLVALLGLAVVVVLSALVYRKIAVRSAYLLTTAPLLAITIVFALVASRLLPAWS